MKNYRESVVTSGTFSSTAILSVALVLVGSGMQGYANATIDTFFVALLLLVSGFAAVRLVSPGSKYERQVFLLTYGVCVFVGGLAQCYSLNVFNNPQSTVDSFTFLRQISAQPPFMTMANMPAFNSPLAIVIWQQVYKLTWWLGFEFGPYTGVIFNALVMGLTGSLTVRTARELFGDDDWRLRRVGILFAFCGLFVMFGSVLLRDCFTTFLNTLVLWGLVRFLVRQTAWRLFHATVLTGISAYAMVYLRLPAVVLFGLYSSLAFLFWFFAKKMSTARLIAAFLVLSILLLGSTYLLNYVQKSQEIQSQGMMRYGELSSNTHAADSLGVRLIINQPLPVRLVLGSGALMVAPIPLWANFNFRSLDSHWIKGYHGIYQVLVIPLVLAGFILCYRMFRREREKVVPFLFLAVYLFINLAAVAVTSLEQRHVAQFLPAFIILAALPDTRDVTTRNELRTITIWWLSVVVLIHLAWTLLKG